MPGILGVAGGAAGSEIVAQRRPMTVFEALDPAAEDLGSQSPPIRHPAIPDFSRFRPESDPVRPDVHPFKP